MEGQPVKILFDEASGNYIGQLTIFMSDCCHAIFPEDIVYIDKLGMAGVCHSMVTDKYNVDDVCEIPGNKGCMKVLGKSVYGA